MDALMWVVGGLLALLYAHAACAALRAHKGEREARTRVVCKAAAMADLALLRVASTFLHVISVVVNVIINIAYSAFDAAYRAGVIPEGVNTVWHSVADATRSVIQNATDATESAGSSILEAGMQVPISELTEESDTHNISVRESGDNSPYGSSARFPASSIGTTKETSSAPQRLRGRSGIGTFDATSDVAFDAGTDTIDVNPDGVRDITLDSLTDSITSPEMVTDRISFTSEGSVEDREILRSRGEAARRRWTEWLRGYLRNLDQGLSLAERAGIFAVQRPPDGDGVQTDGCRPEDACLPLPPPCPGNEDVSLINAEVQTTFKTPLTPELHSTASRTMVSLETGSVAPGSPVISNNPKEFASYTMFEKRVSSINETPTPPPATTPSSPGDSSRAAAKSPSFLKRHRSAPPILEAPSTSQKREKRYLLEPEASFHGPCKPPATQTVADPLASRRHAVSPSISVAVLPSAAQTLNKIPAFTPAVSPIATSDRWREWATEGALAEDRPAATQGPAHPAAKQWFPSGSAPPSASPYARELIPPPTSTVATTSVPVDKSTPVSVPISASPPVSPPVPVPGAPVPVSTSVPLPDSGFIPDLSVPTSGSAPVSTPATSSTAVPVSSTVPVSAAPLHTPAIPLPSPAPVPTFELPQSTEPVAPTTSASPTAPVSGPAPAPTSPDVSSGSTAVPPPTTAPSSTKQRAAPVPDENLGPWLSWLQRSPEEVLARVRALEVRLERERGWNAGTWGERGWNERPWNDHGNSWPAWGTPWNPWGHRAPVANPPRCAGVQPYGNERVDHLEEMSRTRIADIISQKLRPNVPVLGSNLFPGGGPFIPDPLQAPAEPGASPKALSQHPSGSEVALIEEKSALIAPRDVHARWFQGARAPEERVYAPNERWGQSGGPSIAFNDYQEEIYRRDVLKYASLQTKITTMQTPPTLQYRVESVANRKTRDQLTGLSELNVRHIDTQTSEPVCTCQVPEMVQIRHHQLPQDALINASNLGRGHTGDPLGEEWVPSEWPTTTPPPTPCPVCSARRNQNIFFTERRILNPIESGEASVSPGMMEKPIHSPTLSQSPLVSSDSTSPPGTCQYVGMGMRPRRLKHKVGERLLMGDEKGRSVFGPETLTSPEQYEQYTRDITLQDLERPLPPTDFTTLLAPQTTQLSLPFAPQGSISPQVPVAPPAFVRARLAAQLGALVRQLREEVQREGDVSSSPKRHQPSRPHRSISPGLSSSSSSSPVQPTIAIPAPTQHTWSNITNNTKAPWESPKEVNTSKETSPAPSSSMPTSTPSSRRSSIQSKRLSGALPGGVTPAPAEEELAPVPSGEELCFELAGLLRRLHSRSSRETSDGRTDDSLDSASTDSCEVPRKMRCVRTASGHLIPRPVVRPHRDAGSHAVGAGAGGSSGSVAGKHAAVGQQAAEALLKQLRALDAACRRCEALRLSAAAAGQTASGQETTLARDADAAKVLAAQVRELESSLETLSRRMGLIPESRISNSESKARRILRPAPRQRSITVPHDKTPSTHSSATTDEPCAAVIRAAVKMAQKKKSDRECDKKPEQSFTHISAQTTTTPSSNTLGLTKSSLATPPAAVPATCPPPQWPNAAPQQPVATLPPIPATPPSAVLKAPPNPQPPATPSLLTQQSRLPSTTSPCAPPPSPKINRPLSPMVGRDGPHSDRSTTPKFSIPAVQSTVPTPPGAPHSYRNGEDARGGCSVPALVAHASSSSTTRRLRKHAGPLIVENLDMPMDSTH